MALSYKELQEVLNQMAAVDLRPLNKYFDERKEEDGERQLTSRELAAIHRKPRRKR